MLRVRARLASIGAAIVATALVVSVAVAWACNPQAHLQLDAATYEAGSPMTIYGSYFPAGATITVSLSSGATTTVQASSGGGFTTQLTAPAAPGNYSVSATRPTGGFAVASFSVIEAQPKPPVAPPPPPPPAQEPVPAPGLMQAPALLGPTIVRPTTAGETVRASRTGLVELACGRVAEVGVTGTCGAVSRAVTAAGPLMTLRAKPFEAQPARMIRVRFHLTRQRLRQLKARGRIRMRGTVVARGALGNSSARTFAFTLASPRKPTRVS